MKIVLRRWSVSALGILLLTVLYACLVPDGGYVGGVYESVRVRLRRLGAGLSRGTSAPRRRTSPGAVVVSPRLSAGASVPPGSVDSDTSAWALKEDSWRRIQARFVDGPAGAVTEGDQLLGDVMSTRGYPVSDFEQRAARSPAPAC